MEAIETLVSVQIRQRNESRPHKRVPFHRRRGRCHNTYPPCLPRLRSKPNLCRLDARAIKSSRTSHSCRLVAKNVLRHPDDLTRAAVQRHLPAANRREARKHRRLLSDCRVGFRLVYRPISSVTANVSYAPTPLACMRCAKITARSRQTSCNGAESPGPAFRMMVLTPDNAAITSARVRSRGWHTRSNYLVIQ